MGMGFAGAHVITIDESVIASKCPEELAAFKELVAKHGQYYSYMAIEGQGDMLNEEDCDAINMAHNKLIDAFKRKTKLNICYFYHDIEQDGDRYDDIEEGWQVSNAYKMTAAAKRFAKNIKHNNFVMWG